MAAATLLHLHEVEAVGLLPCSFEQMTMYCILYSIGSTVRTAGALVGATALPNLGLAFLTTHARFVRERRFGGLFQAWDFGVGAALRRTAKRLEQRVEMRISTRVTRWKQIIQVAAKIGCNVSVWQVHTAVCVDER